MIFEEINVYSVWIDVQCNIQFYDLKIARKYLEISSF